MRNHEPVPPARRVGGFTFVEVLAAMLAMAIVIPAAIRGVLLANRVGIVAERKREAAQLADRELAELVATEAWRKGDQSGDFGSEWPGYRWELTANGWSKDTMEAVAVTVYFTAQEHEYSVRLSTLAPTTQDTGEVNPASATTTSGGGSSSSKSGGSTASAAGKTTGK